MAISIKLCSNTHQSNPNLHGKVCPPVSENKTFIRKQLPTAKYIIRKYFQDGEICAFNSEVV